MFFSLNKKFLYTIAAFFIIAAVIFLSTFYNVYYNKILEEQRTTFARNQQYISLLYENIRLQKKLDAADKNRLSRYTQELSKEKILASEMIKNYNTRNETIKQGINIIFLNSFLLVLSMIALGFLIRRFIIIPVNNLSETVAKIARGDLSSRVRLKQNKHFLDEVDNLALAFNRMADNIQEKIAEINNQKNFLQSLIDGIPDTLYVIDEQGIIIIANKEYRRLTGNRKNKVDENLNRQISNIIQNSDKAAQIFITYDNRLLAVNAAPLNIKNNLGKKQKLTVNSIRDLSNDIKFSHQQKLSAMGFLATSVAHELKNHLGSIRMLVEALLDKYHQNKDDDSEEKKYLTLINKQLVESINVPERLLRLSREARQNECKTRCNDTIREIAGLLDYEAKRNGITINTALPAKDLYIKMPEIDFRIILLNLLQNAFKAMSDNGKLHIDVKAVPAGKITINVTDNGHGISEENLKRIFDPFFTTDTANLPGSGSGLGLAIVKSIIDNCGGSIKANSVQAKGTRFSMILPRA